MFSGSGPYNVKLTASSSICSKDTTIGVTVRVQPQITFPVQPDVCANIPAYTIVLATISNGVTGTGVYKGTGITDTIAGIFDPAVAGVGSHTITYTYTSSLGCMATANATILVKTVPTSSFTFPTTCLVDGNVQFTNGSTGAASYVWDFGDTSPTVTTTSPLHLFSGSGPYNVKLTATNNGCSKDTTIPVTVRVTPQISFPAQPDVCGNVAAYALAQATITNGVAGTGVYKGTGITDTLAGIFDPAVAGVGPHTITYTFTSALGCTASDNANINVKAVPVASFTYPTGCLANGLVTFTNTSTGTTGLSTYSWNFGDPTSGANNTSTQASPQHNYNQFGTYSIMLTTTTNGCSDDTTITTTFALQPQLVYPVLPSVCQGSAAVSVATAYSPNGVTGVGVYKGNGITDTIAGIFDPAVAGAGTHLITYTLTSTIGSCVGSVSRNIVVNPKPVAALSIIDSICNNTTSTLTSAATIASGRIVTWRWNIDGTDTLINNGLPFTKLFTTDGPHVITLTVISDSGCISNVASKDLNVGPIPVADFSAPADLCMPRGTVQFQDASTVSDNTPLDYVWNFGDGTTFDSTANPTHTYNIGGDSVFIRLTVTSAFSCVDDTVKTIVFRKKPYVNFIPQYDTLCQGQPITFFALSNPPAESTIAGYTWEFGDGGPTSSDTNAVKIYRNPGDYSVKLLVTTNNGCVGDTSKLIRVNLQPVIDAGPSFYAHYNEIVTFNPVVNSPNVTFTWSPTTGLSNSTAIRPSLRVIASQTYTLTATGQGGCQASDSLKVFVMLPINIPNAFSPNGDGVNDTWDLRNLSDYPNSSIEVYNRYGQSVFKADGKVKAWNGASKGKDLPVGTYYYIVDLKDGTQPYTGYVVILK